MKTTVISGRIGRDVEIKQAGNSTLAEFPVAVDVGYGDKKHTIWHRCQVWGKRAENQKFTEMLKKGVKVFISGDEDISTYVNRQGETKLDVTVNVRDLDIAFNQQSEQPQQQQSQYQQQQRPVQLAQQRQSTSDFDDFDDIPFA